MLSLLNHYAMNTKTLLLILLSSIVLEGLLCQNSYDFEYLEIKATIFSVTAARTLSRFPWT